MIAMLDLIVLGWAVGYFLLPVLASDRADMTPRAKRVRIKALVVATMTAALLLGLAAAYLCWVPLARPALVAAAGLLVAANGLLVTGAYARPSGRSRGFDVVELRAKTLPKSVFADGSLPPRR